MEQISRVESLWVEAIRAADDSFESQISFENGYEITLNDRSSGAKLYSDLKQGTFEFSGLAAPSQTKKLKYGFLQTLRRCLTKVNGLAYNPPSIATLSFKICRYFIQVAISYPEHQGQLFLIVSLVESLIKAHDLHSFTSDQRDRQFEAVVACLSQFIVLHDLSQSHSTSFRLVRFVKSVIRSRSPERVIANLHGAVTDLKDALRVETPANPFRAYDRTTLNHNSAAVLGDVDHKIFHANAIFIAGREQLQLHGSRDTTAQILQSYQHHNLPGLYQNMIQKVCASGATNHKGGENENGITSFAHQHTILQFPQLDLVNKTCTWLLGSQVWRQWHRNAGRKLFLITGNLGCGKTSIAKRVLDHESQVPQRRTLSIHFSSAHKSQWPATRAFYVSLVAQLLKFGDTVSRTEVENVLRGFGPLGNDIWRCPQQSLSVAIDKLLDLCQTCFLVVDGLDECGTIAEQQEIAQFLTSLAREKRLSVVVTARQTTLFEEKYSCKVTLSTDSIDDEIADGFTQDLLQYINHRIDSIPILGGVDNRLFRRRIRKSVLRRSQGNFLHARILIDTMSHYQTRGEVQRLLQSSNLNAELKERYDKLSEIIEAPLTESQLHRRRQILQILVVARSPLYLEQLDELLCMDLITGVRDQRHVSLGIKTELQLLGQDFLEISEDGEVRFYHSAAKEYFQNCIHPEDANLYLAHKCLGVLRQNFYQQSSTASGLLKGHILKDVESASNGSRPFIDESPIYEYAALHFHEHVASISAPPPTLICKLSRFLHGIEFVTWSESLVDFGPENASSRRTKVYRDLHGWSTRLPIDEQEKIEIQDFFKLSHTSLAETLQPHEDKTLQYLPRIRIAEYLNAGPQSSRDLETSHEQRKIVVAGLSELRGADDPFVMTNRATLYMDYLWKKEFVRARNELEQLHDTQKRLLKPGQADIYVTAWVLAGAHIALGDNASAQLLLADAIEWVRQNFGETFRLFLLLFLLEGQRSEVLRDFKKATACYKLVLEVNEKLAGPENGMTIMAKVAMGAILRKQQQFDSAYRLLFAGFAARNRTVSVNLNVTVDAGLQLALLQRDRHAYQDCRRVLEAIQTSIVFEEDFERYCQLVHLNALVAFDQGYYPKPKSELLHLIEEASGEHRSRNNRELLWIRLDLSDVMRQHEDDNEALMLFTDLVRTKNELDAELNDYAQPESAEQLRAAETALGYVREARMEEAQAELDRLNLEWVRSEDFHIMIQGGPTLDTSVIRPISSC